jgi:hypothetical protein
MPKEVMACRRWATPLGSMHQRRPDVAEKIRRAAEATPEAYFSG